LEMSRGLNRSSNHGLSEAPKLVLVSRSYAERSVAGAERKGSGIKYWYIFVGATISRPKMDLQLNKFILLYERWRPEK
jgi:hypothetical protein